jgi:hypothetical protein
MSDQALRSKLIRLAHNNPELRPHLMPLLGKTAGPFESVDSSKSDYGAAQRAMNDAIAYLRMAEENASKAFDHAIDGAEQNPGQGHNLLVKSIAQVHDALEDCRRSQSRPMHEAFEALTNLAR